MKKIERGGWGGGGGEGMLKESEDKEEEENEGLIMAEREDKRRNEGMVGAEVKKNEEMREDGQGERENDKTFREDMEEVKSNGGWGGGGGGVVRGNGDEDLSKDDIFCMIRAELNDSRQFEDTLTVANRYRTTLLSHLVKIGASL